MTLMKQQILQIVAQTITNPNKGGAIIGIQGPPGVGKTRLIQDGISKALNRPLSFISLGGATDSCFLDGHDYTYEGSKWGNIVDSLIKTKCMNPIIFFDELDKVSKTHRGEEIMSILTHITDITQNSHFNDKYFNGIDFDLSRVLIVFSFNNEWEISKILKDRMYIIRTDSLNMNDKIKIANKFLIPSAMKSVGFMNKDIVLNNNIIKFIINKYTQEGGVRRLKECISEIIKEVNLRLLCSNKINNQRITKPLIITEKMLTKDIFKKRYKYKKDKIHKYPKIGLINGLWANDLGVGGIMNIEAISIPTSSKLMLELTGLQGDVMKESMKCAKTIAWNLLTAEQKTVLNNEWKEFGPSGFHIHCPEAATPKDGPSAGTAITICILSLLSKRPIKNNIAITGEINLQGNVTEIGGLSEKLYGAKEAGVNKVLIPRENLKDLKKITTRDPLLLSNNFNVIPIDTIDDAIKHCIVE